MIQRIARTTEAESSCQSTPRLYIPNSNVCTSYSTSTSNSQSPSPSLSSSSLSRSASSSPTHTTVKLMSPDAVIDSSHHPSAIKNLQNALYLYKRINEHDHEQKEEPANIEQMRDWSVSSPLQVHPSPYHAVGISTLARPPSDSPPCPPPHTPKSASTTESPAFYAVASASACTQKKKQEKTEEETTTQNQCPNENFGNRIRNKKTKRSSRERGTAERKRRKSCESTTLGTHHVDSNTLQSPIKNNSAKKLDDKVVGNNNTSLCHRFACNASIVIDCERKIRRNKSLEHTTKSSSSATIVSLPASSTSPSTTALTDSHKQQYQVQSKYCS